MSSIRCSINPSNLVAPVKVNSRLMKDYDFTYNSKKFQKTNLDIIYDSYINDDSCRYKRKTDPYEEYQEKQFIRSSIPRRFYKTNLNI